MVECAGTAPVWARDSLEALAHLLTETTAAQSECADLGNLASLVRRKDLDSLFEERVRRYRGARVAQVKARNGRAMIRAAAALGERRELLAAVAESGGWPAGVKNAL